jgi:hypothetical protein
MKIEDIYKNCTAQGCKTALQNFSNVDQNQTFGEAVEFLKKRVVKAETETKKLKQN